MAVYQVFAAADATLYSRYPSKNTGRDSILEVSAKNSQDGVRFLGRTSLTENPYYTYDLAASTDYSTTDFFFPGSDVRRSILRFSNEELSKLKTFASQSVSGSWAANLKLYLASAQNLSTDYTIQAYPLSQSWEMGTGEYAQVPESRNGVSWLYTGPYQASTLWAETGSSYISSVGVSQSFDYMSNKDLNVNITPIVDDWFSGSQGGGLPNYGLVVKHPDAVEKDPDSYIDLKFFSVDTHTIYPPTLQFKWDDSYYFPQGSNYALDNELTVTLRNNQGTFRQGQVYKLRTSVRYTYPPRTFSTASAYLNSIYLPENSYWALQDAKTGEMVIGFDEKYTKLSADSVSNYFTLYTSGLEINRYYSVLIKTNIYTTTYGPLSLYNNDQSIYNALALYGADDLKLLPTEEVIYSGQNLTFKIVE